MAALCARAPEARRATPRSRNAPRSPGVLPLRQRLLHARAPCAAAGSARKAYLQLPFEPTLCATASEAVRGLDALRDAEVVAIDCEWRPQKSRAEALRPVALLQVASAGSALLIDLHVIAAQEGVAGMTLVGAALTETLVGGGRAETQGAQEGHGKGEASGAAAGDRRAPLLVGYVLGFDLRRLATSYRCFASLEAARCVDLRRVCRYLAKAPDAVRRARGLSGLCRATLGLPLSKRMQCSNWEARPLSREQMYYAALDAQACVAVWNTWRQMYGADCVEAACQGGGGQIRWAARERPSVLEAIGKRPRNARQEKKIAKKERLERERERKEARQRRKREAKAAAATQADAQTPRRKAHKPRGFAEGCLKSQQQENATPV